MAVLLGGLAILEMGSNLFDVAESEEYVESLLQEKRAVHDSRFTGQDWVNELIHGYPRHIHTALGMSAEAFQKLVETLCSMGETDSCYVTLEEQVAIYLYTMVTGLACQHVGERFQRANDTITGSICLYFSKYKF